MENKRLSIWAFLNKTIGKEHRTMYEFPEFYNNPIIQSIAPVEKWTVSDKTKRPIDMKALIERQEIWGASFKRGYNPLVDLNTLRQAIPNATNNAFYLDAERDGIVVLDAEPYCPDQVKELFLGLPYLYGETSMSGKGIHLIFKLPHLILERYPNAKTKMALREEHGYYEILMNHMVTFTRNVIPRKPILYDNSVFDNIFELLASQATVTVKAESINAEDIDISSIPYSHTIINVLKGQTYYKKLTDFVCDKGANKYDNSKYEYNMALFYYQRFQRMTQGTFKMKDHEYTAEEKAVIIYEVIKEKIEHREKHDTLRNGMPWLLYIASTMVSKTDLYNAEHPNS